MIDSLIWFVGCFVLVWLTLALVVGLIRLVLSRSSNRLSYRDKHVLISGASTGLGFAFAQLAAQRGAKVSIVSKHAGRLAHAATELQALASHRVVAEAADVGSNAAVVEAVRRAEAVHGPVDVVVACAGLAQPGLVESTDAAVYEEQMRLNYLGSVHLVKAALPAMIARDKPAKIVLVSSACGTSKSHTDLRTVHSVDDCLTIHYYQD
jgi:3-dehydrosphinganine reductase